MRMDRLGENGKEEKKRKTDPLLESAATGVG